MRNTYEIPEILEQEYREEFVLKSKIRMNNKYRDKVFAMVVAIIFLGLLALSLLLNVNSNKKLSDNYPKNSEKINVSQNKIKTAFPSEYNWI